MDKLESYLDFFEFSRELEGVVKCKDEKLYKNIFSAKFRVLFFLHRAGSATATELVNRLMMQKSNVASMCKELKKRNLILCKESGRDRRVVYYSLSKLGERKVLEIVEDYKKILEGAFGKENAQIVSEHFAQINKIFKENL